MDLKQLEYFVCVAETLNFTKAARLCFVSQTTMTTQIKALEEYLGVPLFIRDKHHVELTSAGKIYINEARSILTRAGDAKNLLQTVAEGAAGSLTIGFIRGYEQTTLTETIRDFSLSSPNISVHLRRDNQSPLYEKLLNGECDCIFSLLPIMKSYPELETRELRPSPLFAVLYPGHPLEERKTLTYEDLKGFNLIITQPETRSYDEAEEVLLFYNRGGYVPQIVLREAEPQMVLFMVSVRMGIAVLPEYVIRYINGAPNLRFKHIVRPDGSPETLAFGLSWRKDNPNPALAQFLNWTKLRDIVE